MAEFLTRVTRDQDAIWQESIDGDSPEFTRSRTDYSSTRKFIVPVSQLDLFNSHCFPDLYGPSGQHPVADALFVNNWAAKPFHDNDITEFYPGMSSPSLYMITVNYSPYSLDAPKIIDFGSDPTIPYNELIGNMGFRTEAMTLPGKAFKWETSTVVVKEEINPVMMIQLMDFTIATPKTASIPFTAIRDNMGKVNANQFFGGAAETVLYQGTQVGFRFGNDGSRSFELSHQFTEKRIQWDGNIYGWNHFMDPATYKWDRLINRDTNLPTYTTSTTFQNLMA